jgi:TonB family protein
MRPLLAGLLVLPFSLVAQAPTCQPKHALVVDTTHTILGVRVRLASDSIEDALLTRRIGEAMVAASFRVPGTISRAFYPGTGGDPITRANAPFGPRLLTRVTSDPLPSDELPWRTRLETPSEDPATDTVFVAALREAVRWVLPPTTDTPRMPWVAELVLTVPGDPAVHPLARLTVPTIRLERPTAIKRIDMPRFPEEHRDKGQGGAVRLQFVVDERGRVEPASLRVLSAPSLAFAMSAKEALLTAEYTPAQAGGCPQKQLVQQNVRFTFGARQVRVR